MHAIPPTDAAALENRITEGTARIRACVQARDWGGALAAARARQADLEALARLGAIPTASARSVMEAALRGDRAVEPEVRRLRTLARTRLRHLSRGLHASSEYRVLGDPDRP